MAAPSSTYKSYIYALTFLTYSILYTTRSAYSYNKTAFSKDMGLTNEFLGTLDMLFLICLAVSYLIFGEFAKKMEIKNFLSIGLIPASILFLSFPVMDLYNVREPALILIVTCLNGLVQACIWPSLIAVMGNWFGKGNRGLLMGIWACNANFGNIIGM